MRTRGRIQDASRGLQKPNGNTTENDTSMAGLKGNQTDVSMLNDSILGNNSMMESGLMNTRGNRSESPDNKRKPDPMVISNKPVVQGTPITKQGNNMILMPTGGKTTGLEKMRDLKSIYVKQKFELLEALTGCETENRYKVYAANDKLERTGEPIFKCKERSNFFARNCLSGDCRPFQMRILHEDDDGDEEDLWLNLNRPCKFTFYCLNRPEITVTLKENNQDKYIGKVISQWACCDMLFDILDEKDQLLYKIHGTCCQWGLFCNCPCDKCAKIEFQIRSPGGDKIGEIFKIYSGVMKEMFTDTDNFCCVFPVDADPNAKALLLACVLFIDFRYFETAPQQNPVE